MIETKLEKIFMRAAKMPHDGCSLPEPDRGAPPILSNISLIKIDQRRGLSPDELENFEEHKRFQKFIQEQEKNGGIDKKTAKRMSRLW